DVAGARPGAGGGDLHRPRQRYRRGEAHVVGRGRDVGPQRNRPGPGLGHRPLGVDGGPRRDGQGRALVAQDVADRAAGRVDGGVVVDGVRVDRQVARADVQGQRVRYGRRGEGGQGRADGEGRTEIGRGGDRNVERVGGVAAVDRQRAGGVGEVGVLEAGVV